MMTWCEVCNRNRDDIRTTVLERGHPLGGWEDCSFVCEECRPDLFKGNED